MTHVTPLSGRWALRAVALGAALTLPVACTSPKAPAPKAASTPAEAAPVAQPSKGAVKAAAGLLASAQAKHDEAKDKAAKEAKRKEIEQAALAKIAAEGMPANANALPQIAPGTIEKAVMQARTAPGEDTGIAPKWMVKRIRNVAANHDAPALKKWCTPRLQAEIDKMLPKHGERFWRHLDRYADAGANGYEVKEQRREGPDRLHLTVHAKGDIVLKPVLERAEQGWRFDRF